MDKFYGYENLSHWKGRSPLRPIFTLSTRNLNFASYGFTLSVLHSNDSTLKTYIETDSESKVIRILRFDGMELFTFDDIYSWYNSVNRILRLDTWYNQNSATDHVVFYKELIPAFEARPLVTIDKLTKKISIQFVP